MRCPFVVAALLLALGPVPARAGAMLYATASGAQRVDGFCLGPNGGMASDARVQQGTGGIEPRRVLVVNGVLYVAELDRVEAYDIGPGGGLTRRGRTAPRSGQPNIDPRDIEASADGTTLYVPHRGEGFLAAYPLPFSGETDFVTCVQGAAGFSYQQVSVAGDKLYVSGGGSFGSIVVYPLGQNALFPSDANALPQTPTDCGKPLQNEARPDPFEDIAPERVSLRRLLARPSRFEIRDGVLYVVERDNIRITAFRLLSDGNFCPTEKGAKKKNRVCLATLPTDSKDIAWLQPSDSHTRAVARYQTLLLYGSTLIATEFNQGRVVAFALGEPRKADDQCTPGTCLPARPTRRLPEDLTATPVHMHVALAGPGNALPEAEKDVLYVSTGAANRIRAYKLENGLPAKTFFSETKAVRNTFPNDVAVAVLSANCN
jgi:hypothetical protein